jgi:excisionase family DNA binding protein
MLEHNTPIESVMAPEEETQLIRQLENVLKVGGSQTKLVGANGEQIAIPESVYQLLCKAVHSMALGQAVYVVSQEQEMSTQQAATLLNVSRPYLIKLLEQGEIPYIQVGSHRRICFQDVIRYKKQRDAMRRGLLDELIQESQDMGFYE